MRLGSKFLIVAMIVMMICCVSAASATDVGDIVVPEDTEVIEIDDAVDSVDVVEQEDSSDDVIEDVVADDINSAVNEDESDDANDDILDENSRAGPGYNIVNSSNYLQYFDLPTGLFKNTCNLEFQGTFSNLHVNNLPFKYFVINKDIKLRFTNAVFNNVGFKLLYPGLTIDGGATFTNNEWPLIEESIYVGANNVTIKNVNINVNAPSNKNCYAINVLDSNYTQLLNNNIYYLCNYSNPDYYNYVIKVKNSTGVKIAGNTITADLPLKTVKHYEPGIEGLDKDFVAGVGVTNSSYLNFTKNTVDITANRRVGDYPTLDAFIMWYSDNSYVGDNTISVIDEETSEDEYSYIYGVDLYKSNYVDVYNNTINMNADQSGGYVGGNGTGAAYCVQCTGSYTGVTVSNNRLTTKNNGPNAAIYSQNWDGPTSITVSGNTIEVTGKGTDINWDVLTGMELQDTYATVTGNTITVTNNGDYYDGYNVYGISYCQYTPYGHTYVITGNTVDVDGGKYTIFLLSGTTNTISGNTLSSYDGINHYSGNQTIETNG